jgi:VanZ family protein
VTIIVWDKALHMVEYAVLAMLLCRALRGEGLDRFASAVVAIVAASAYGVTDEWHQMLISGRESDVRDWLADTVGALLGSMLTIVKKS